MKRINAIIIDDEASAAKTLRGMLKEYCPMVNIAHVANSVEQGVLSAEQYQPEVVFLDIEMPPYGNGFDFLDRTRHLDFGVIFTTAHAQYAIKAINDVQPWAYLVKPYKTAELVQAVQIAIARSAASPVTSTPQHRGLLLSDMRKGNIVVRHTDLVYCQADGSCTNFYTLHEGKFDRYSAYKNLKEVESELPDALFCRTHHSFLVNLSYVRRYERVGRTGKVHLINNTTIDVSAQKLDNFVRHFNRFLKGV
ncbi:MAG: response regulator transcription factor [Bacteroidetes bacterium]|nr:MAG: response regulator transcription factor [Bacteroidota bacterium]